MIFSDRDWIIYLIWFLIILMMIKHNTEIYKIWALVKICSSKNYYKNVILLFCFILIFFFYNKFVKIKKKFNLFV